VRWLHLLYNNFTAFSRDQEHLISFSKKNVTADYVEGMLLLNQPPLDLSFYPISDHQRITSLVTQNGIIYIIELVKYYDNNSKAFVEKVVNKCCKFVMFSWTSFTFIYYILSEKIYNSWLKNSFSHSKDIITCMGQTHCVYLLFTCDFTKLTIYLLVS